MYKDELKNRLLALDDDAYLLNVSNGFEIIIGGGAALVLNATLSRATYDIDTVSNIQKIEDLCNTHDLNMKMTSYMPYLPINYRDRIKKMKIQTKCLAYFTLSNEDLIVMKLYSPRAKDIDDLKTIIEKKSIVRYC